MKLFLNGIVKFTVGLLLVCAMLFLPAGTLNFVNGWLFIVLLFVPMVLFGAILFIKSPKLLKKRLDVKEKHKTQKGVVGISAILFIAGFIVAGLDFRFCWSNVPRLVVIIASLILLTSYALYMEVMRENIYLSRTVKVEENQKVIDKGLYSIVRHPMYSVTVWLFLSIPLVLGSWWALICFVPYIAVIAVRIIDEEKLLGTELDGYEEYKKRVKYRLIPYIW